MIFLKAIAGACNILPGWIWALIVAGALGAAGVERIQAGHYKSALAAEKLARVTETAARQQATIAQAAANAQETARRLEAQRKADELHAQELARLQVDAGRNRADADSLRDQNASVARKWRDALGHSPTPVQCAAAGDAISLQADVLARADRRAGILAEIADAARAAGNECAARYDALTK